tara:strand:+ start:19 stop:690 length:672 start_codon:yes stop_codon:yes gene_type:complete
MLGTSNRTVLREVQNAQQQNFKTVNNLLTLQENHVEEFFEYHGENFLFALEKLMEDVTERVVAKMLGSLEFVHNTTNNMITVQESCLREFEKITQENIDLDIQNLLATALNSEVIMQRRMAKQQYLESQGFGGGQPAQTQQQPVPTNIQGAPQTGVMNQQLHMQQNAMNNQSGYPVPPTGYDQYNNPYWIDPATGQATYTPPSSGLGLARGVAKAAAWAKWLA